MLIQRRNGSLVIIRQTDHSTQCGEMGALWNGMPGIPGSTRAAGAAAIHDNGWQEWEDHAALNPKTRLPYPFYAIPVTHHLGLYRRGIERAIKADPYQGLLVSLHGVGLYNGRFGLVRDFGPRHFSAEEEELVRPFMAEQRTLQDQLARQTLGLPGLPEVGEHPLWHDYAFLQVLDTLSLVSLSSRPEQTTIGLTLNGAELSVEPLDVGAFRLAPYPFSGNVEMQVPAAYMLDTEFTSDEEFAHAFANARNQPLIITFQP